MSMCVSHSPNLILLLTGEFTMKPVSLWVVTDLSTPSGRQMILNVLKFMVNNPLIIL